MKRLFEFSVDRTFRDGFNFILLEFSVEKYSHRPITICFLNLRFCWYYPEEIDYPN